MSKHRPSFGVRNLLVERVGFSLKLSELIPKLVTGLQGCLCKEEAVCGFKLLSRQKLVFEVFENRNLSAGRSSGALKKF